MLNILI